MANTEERGDPLMIEVWEPLAQSHAGWAEGNPSQSDADLHSSNKQLLSAYCLLAIALGTEAWLQI